MHGIFTYVYRKNQPNVGKYSSPMDSMGNSSPMSQKGWKISAKSCGHASDFSRKKSPELEAKKLGDHGTFRGQPCPCQRWSLDDGIIITWIAL